MQMRIR